MALVRNTNHHMANAEELLRTLEACVYVFDKIKDPYSVIRILRGLKLNHNANPFHLEYVARSIEKDILKVK